MLNTYFYPFQSHSYHIHIPVISHESPVSPWFQRDFPRFLMLHLLSFSVAPLLVTLLMGCFLRPEKALNFGVALAFWATTPAALPKNRMGWVGPLGSEPGGDRVPLFRSFLGNIGDELRCDLSCCFWRFLVSCNGNIHGVTLENSWWNPVQTDFRMGYCISWDTDTNQLADP